MNRTLGFFAAALIAISSSAAATPVSEQALRARAAGKLVGAAARNDEAAMWSSLSRVSRRKLGPTLADFRRRGARGVRASVAAFVGGTYRVVVNATVDRELGVVAIARGSESFATPLRQEGGVWKVEIAPSIAVEAVRPLPGERVVRRTQLAAELAAASKLDGAGMWFDGAPFEPRMYFSNDGKRASLWGEAPQPLRAGRHVVVAFASTTTRASAAAWTFTVQP